MVSEPPIFTKTLFKTQTSDPKQKTLDSGVVLGNGSSVRALQRVIRNQNSAISALFILSVSFTLFWRRWDATAGVVSPMSPRRRLEEDWDAGLASFSNQERCSGDGKWLRCRLSIVSQSAARDLGVIFLAFQTSSKRQWGTPKLGCCCRLLSNVVTAFF